MKRLGDSDQILFPVTPGRESYANKKGPRSFWSGLDRKLELSRRVRRCQVIVPLPGIPPAVLVTAFSALPTTFPEAPSKDSERF